MRKSRKVEECLGKIELSTSHLLALVNDVLDMSKIQAEEVEESEEAFDLVELMDEVAGVMDAQITETGFYIRNIVKYPPYASDRKSAAPASDHAESVQ